MIVFLFAICRIDLKYNARLESQVFLNHQGPSKSLLNQYKYCKS